MRPRVPITSEKFIYVDAANTDIRKTFLAAKARMAAEAKLRQVIAPRLRRVNG